MRRGEKGFTMIELILVITLLGILAVVALPRFFNMGTQARQASRDGVVASVRSGVALWRANDLVTGGPGNYPTTLDAQADGACATCFGTVLDQALTDGSWTKAGLVYTHNDGAATTNYTYNPATGTFQ
ncbi:MAG: type II secretion system protein [Deltaproteobacteria bacterium]|nr:type II secretion system protein [Deltaproteobacteria bacterium]